jgi:hypothetical protein
LEDAVALREAISFRRHAHEIANTRMLDHHALGMAGRARGIDDVADLISGLGRLTGAQGRGGLSRDRGAFSINCDVQQVDRGERFGKAGGRDDRAQVGVARDELDAVCRKPGVKRDIGGVDLHHREHRNVRVGGLVEQQTDAVAGPDAAAEQHAGEAVCPGVEFGEGQSGGTRVDGDASGEFSATMFDQMIEPLTGTPADRGLVRVA